LHSDLSESLWLKLEVQMVDVTTFYHSSVIKQKVTRYL